jgi:WD40 repeat protein
MKAGDPTYRVDPAKIVVTFTEVSNQLFMRGCFKKGV